MLALAFALAVLASPSSPQLKIASPGLTGVRVSEPEATFFSEHLAQQLAAAGAKVTSDREISALLGLERKRQLLGCSEGSSQCVTELAGALGVDALVVGDVAKLQSRYQANIKLIAVNSAELLAAESVRADTDEQLVDALTAVAGRLASRGAEKLSRSLSPEGTMGTTASGRPRIPVLTIIFGSTALVTGGFGGLAFAQANSRYQELLVTTSGQRALQLREEGVLWRVATQVGLGVGAAALAGAVVTFIAGDMGSSGTAPEISVLTTPRGSSVALSWRWP